MGKSATEKFAKKLSFKRGTAARKERSKIAEAIKEKGNPDKVNPFAVATSVVKKKFAKKKRK